VAVAKVGGMRVGIVSAAVLGDVNNNELINIGPVQRMFIGSTGREGVMEHDVVLKEIHIQTSSSPAIDLEGVADWDSSEDEEEEAKTVESEGGEEKEK